MDTQRILIEHQKNADVYWNATGSKLFAAALRILNQRMENGIIATEAKAKRDQERYIVKPELTQEQIDALPTGSVKDMAQHQFNRIARSNQAYADAVDLAIRIKEIIEDGLGGAAWEILQERKRYEYEGFELAVLLDPDKEQGDQS